MANTKRASMREGPLAALFRSTTDELPEGEREVADVPREQPAPPRAAAPGPSTAAAGAPAIAPRVADQPRRIVPVEAQPAPSTRSTPHERLRQAFSSDLPDDVLAPPRPVAPTRVEPAWPTAAYDDASVHVTSPGQPVIRVVGVGGAGVNAVNRMIEAQVGGVEFVAVNTDVQSLQGSEADVRLHIGPDLTRGLGAGADPELGRQAAMEDFDRLKAILKGSDMVFVAAGAGGGTGTGAGPVVARIARELGALTVGIVTKPFGFEGTRRQEAATHGVEALAAEVDTLIVVPNDKLLTVLDKQTSMVDAFRTADDVLRQGVQGVSDLVTLPGLINLDFADVRTIMSEAGPALLGIGMGTGERRATEAAIAAVASPLLETSMEGASKILLSITGGEDLSLWEVNESAKAVAEAAHPDANIIFGAMVDEKLNGTDQVWVTVVATGYGDAPRALRPARRPEPTRFEEPRGELRVERRRPVEPRERVGASTRRTGLGVTELDVPEFVPRSR